MTGCRVSVKFWDDQNNDFQYKGPYTALATLKPPVDSLKEEEKSAVSTGKTEEDRSEYDSDV